MTADDKRDYRTKKLEAQDRQETVNKCLHENYDNERDFILNVGDIPEMARVILGVNPEVDANGDYKRVDGSHLLWGEVGNFDPGLKVAAHKYFSDQRKKCIPSP